MEGYLKQLIEDVNEATQNLNWPYIKKEAYDLQDAQSCEEEEATASIRYLPEWTTITQEMLPPSNALSNQQTHDILEALKKLLEECNCHFVLQTEVPERFQYEAIRQNWGQQVKVLEWNMGFFEMCKRGTPLKTCALGEHCQCAFYDDLFKGMIDDELTPEEERARDLEFEIRHLKKKHGSDWMKYYPYHLDKGYDDENGNPYNYGFEGDEDEDENEDNWWRK